MMLPTLDPMCALDFASSLELSPFAVSPAVAAFVELWFASLDQDERERAEPLLACAIGTARVGDEAERERLITEWLLGVWLPQLLERSGEIRRAAQLRDPYLSDNLDGYPAAAMRVLEGVATAGLVGRSIGEFVRSARMARALRGDWFEAVIAGRQASHTCVALHRRTFEKLAAWVLLHDAMVAAHPERLFDQLCKATVVDRVSPKEEDHEA